MALKVLATKNAPAAVGPYSQGMQSGGFVYVSGQLPIDPSTSLMVKDTIENATRMSLENCKAIIESAGLTLNDVVKAEIFIKDMNEFGAMNSVYGEYFTDHKPARACVEVARLPLDAKIEIQMIAYK
ncbi:RidA family protein [Helicovermis profundi]|uniref:RidA family protein n=1 Tax=Helicovermis profundi TaxID=3065157 RepID=A0AAU9E8Y9_9FIRM|nr:RidA family protein [Clostridia bacterium S502]